MSQKDLQKEIVANLRAWQKMEDASVASTKKIIAKTKNPIISLIMEIIQHDSKLHHQVQEWLADSLEKTSISLSPDELNEIWEMVEKHISLEKKMVENVKKAISLLPKSAMLTQKYFLDYLLIDEKKHDDLLSDLKNFKRAMATQT